MSYTVDLASKVAVRDILGDKESPFVYSEERIELALWDNRDIVLYRNPLFSANSVFAYPILFYGRGQTPINKTDTVRSHLHPEPGRRAFQADRWCRHWDARVPPDVYKSAVLQTAGTDYVVNYTEGRVTFLADVADYETVTASFCYYRIYHAARDVLMSGIVSGEAGGTDLKVGDLSLKGPDFKERLAAINAVIANQTPRDFRIGHRVY